MPTFWLVIGLTLFIIVIIIIVLVYKMNKAQPGPPIPLPYSTQGQNGTLRPLPSNQPSYSPIPSQLPYNKAQPINTNSLSPYPSQAQNGTLRPIPSYQQRGNDTMVKSSSPLPSQLKNMTSSPTPYKAIFTRPPIPPAYSYYITNNTSMVYKFSMSIPKLNLKTSAIMIPLKDTFNFRMPCNNINSATKASVYVEDLLVSNTILPGSKITFTGKNDIRRLSFKVEIPASTPTPK